MANTDNESLQTVADTAVEEIIKETVKNSAGDVQTTILVGKALAPINRERITIKGNIDAPSLFFSGSKSKGKYSSSAHPYAVVCKDEKSIVLYTNEYDPLCTVVHGKLELTEDLKAARINPDVANYSLEDLKKWVRFNRRLFQNTDQHQGLLKSLMEYTAQRKIDIVAQNDNRGNIHNSVKQEVFTDVPISFVLKMEVFKGFNTVSFHVDVYSSLTDSNVRFWLESVELRELIETQTEFILREEEKSLKGLGVTVVLS